MGPIQRRLLWAALQSVSWPRRTLVIAAALLVLATGLATWKLGISTDQNRLFSAKAPFFRDYLDFTRKFPENEALYIIVEPRDAAARPPVAHWIALADAITDRVRGLTDFVQSVDSHIPLGKLGAQGILFEKPGRVREIVAEARRSIPLVKLWAEPPGPLQGLIGDTPMERFLGGLALQPPDSETGAFIAALAESWNQTLAAPAIPGTPAPPADAASALHLPDLEALAGEPDPSRQGYYYVPDETDKSRSLLLIRVYPKQIYTSLTAISDQVDAIRRAAASAAASFPEFSVGVSGRPALEADEMRTSDRDSTRAEIAALITVFIALIAVLRSVRLAAAAVSALAVAIGWTFGYATLAVGELNLLSIVFLIALIGIGMDYLVQILARYRAEIGRHHSPRALWAAVFGQVSAPINTACLGAAGAFLVSAFSHFKGAAELGIIAGGGLLLCLLSGYTVLPALLTLFPLRGPPPEPHAAQEPPHLIRRGRRWLITPALWLALIAAAWPLAVRTRFDPGLISLQAPNLESVRLVRKLQTWSAAVLSKDADLLRRVRDALAAAPTVGSTESALDAMDNSRYLAAEGRMPEIRWSTPAPVKPTDLDSIRRRALAIADRYDAAASPDATAHLHAAASALRSLAQRLADPSPEQAASIASRLAAWQQGFVNLLRSQLENLAPPPLDLAAVPPELRGHYISPDGALALYIYPKADLWDRGALARFLDDIEPRASAIPGAPPVTGIAPNVYYSTESIQRSFYHSTLYALGLVLILVFIDLRRPGQTLMAVSVLALGLPILAAIMTLAGVPWNFANFFGLPILIGAGHEYGVFLVHRYREARKSPSRAWPAWDASDSALLLCAIITSGSFGWFWALAHHQGLKSLGLVMAVGIACIYLSGLLALRPTLKWLLERQASAAAKPAPRSGAQPQQAGGPLRP